MIYLGNINIGGTQALERISKHATDALHDAGVLDRIICRQYTGKSSILRKTVQLQRSGGDEEFDLVAKDWIKDSDILYFWDQHAYESVKKAKDLGMKLVCDRASTHPVYQSGILRGEYEKFGATLQLSPKIIARSVETYNMSDYVVVPSQFAYDSFLYAGFPEEKLKIINFGVDIDKFRPLDDEHEGFRMLFCGMNYIRKGLAYLLRVMRDLPDDVSLSICGASTGVEHPKCVELGVRDDMEKIYPQHDIFVFPTLEEGSSLACLEALSCGLPVITTKNAGSFIQDWKSGFIVPIQDTNALREKIMYFYNNPEEVKKFGREAREEALKHPWSKYGGDMVEFIKQVR